MIVLDGLMLRLASLVGVVDSSVKIWKFCTMTITETSDVVTQATKGYARITKFDVFLRGTSLDEFMLFKNVLKGDMAVIGPSSHEVEHTEEYR